MSDHVRVSLCACMCKKIFYRIYVHVESITLKALERSHTLLYQESKLFIPVALSERILVHFPTADRAQFSLDINLVSCYLLVLYEVAVGCP